MFAVWQHIINQKYQEKKIVRVSQLMYIYWLTILAVSNEITVRNNKSFFISWYEPGDIFLAFKAAEVKNEWIEFCVSPLCVFCFYIISFSMNWHN